MTNKGKKTTKAQKLKQSRIQYAIVKNYLGSTAEARKASKLSPKTFRDRYGLNVTKNIPKIRKYKESTYKKHQSELLYYNQLKEVHISNYDNKLNDFMIVAKKRNYSNELIRLKKKELQKERDKGIKESIIRKKMPKAIQTETINFAPQQKFRFRYPSDKRDRRKLWGEWVSNKNMPLYIQRLIYRVNLRQGYEASANYGYAVVYEAIYQNMSVEEVEKYIEVDPFSRGDYYQFVARIGG